MRLYKSLINPLSENISELSFMREIGNLHKYYFINNPLYNNWVKFFFNINSTKKIDQIVENNNLDLLPFLPSSSFKYDDLINVNKSQIIKTLKSSGTSSGSPSKIYLDKTTSDLMSERLRLDTNNAIGNYRRPLFVLDEKSIFSDRKSFVARGAAIAGLLKYGKPINFLFHDNKFISESLALLNHYLKQGEVLLVGTTINVWLLFLNQAIKKKLDLTNATLVHGGGWKKIENLGVNNNLFKETLLNKLNLKKSINFFGMVEQLGSVSYECAFGNLHVPSCSRYLIRDPESGKAIEDGQIGLLQVNSILSYSYPGASILTDDLGSVDSNHQCPCGNKNPVFNFYGRQKFAEIRGCGT